MFIMLAKIRDAKLSSDFGPIASVRIWCKVFTYMVLARIEPVLDASQPEEQHACRCRSRLEEHLVSANLVIDKLLAVGKPVWIVSLDLSKAFDRVNWSKLGRSCCTWRFRTFGLDSSMLVLEARRVH